MARTPRSQAPADTAPQLAEIGVSGLRSFSGYLDEEFLPELRGVVGRRKFREMADNDPTVGAFLQAITLVIRAVAWDVDPAEDAPNEAQAEAESKFVESILEDMSHTFEDFVGECVWGSCVYGFSPHEIVLKVRQGPDQTDPARRSKYSDGRIGVRKLPLRSQDSVEKWEMQEDGGIAGLWQQPPQGGALRFIPIERMLLFRTISRKNNPEGVSILRTAYKPWFYLNRTQEIEGIGIERELAGMPVISIPGKYLRADATPAERSVRALYEQAARDLRLNSQGGLVIPSEMHLGKDGAVSQAPLVKVELLKTGGPRAIDTNATVARYQRDIARAALADFLLLGSDGKGSYALSDNKTSLFYRAMETLLWDMAAVLNRHLIPRVWAINGLDPDYMPKLRPGRLAGVDLGKLGEFVQRLSAAGAPLFPDDELENHLRQEGDLPPKSEDAKAMQAGMLGAPAPGGRSQTPAAGAAGQEPKSEQGEEIDAEIGKAEPRTLYVCRPVLNGDEIRAWAKSQGLASTLPAGDLHVTVAFSRTPVDWMAMGEASAEIEIAEGGPRLLEFFGPEKNVLVLAFASWQLSHRHGVMREHGASWDWPEYQPHVTITYVPGEIDRDQIEPYRGRIVLGPEKFAEIDDGWHERVEEIPL